MQLVIRNVTKFPWAFAIIVAIQQELEKIITVEELEKIN